MTNGIIFKSQNVSSLDKWRYGAVMIIICTLIISLAVFKIFREVWMKRTRRVRETARPDHVPIAPLSVLSPEVERI
jgi:hypothetical protein